MHIFAHKQFALYEGTGTVTATVVGTVKFSAGTLSSNRSDLTFSNSNGVSFGLETNGVLTGSVETNYQSPGAYLTTAMASDAGSNFAGTNGAITGGSLTVNSSGVSIDLPAYLTTAMASDAGSNFAGTNGAITGGSITVNSSGVSVDLPAYLTTAMASDAGSNFAGTNGAITGGSITVNSSGVSVALPAYLTTAMASNAVTISNIKVSAGTLSSNRSDITFSNSNGISFGLETNGVITASGGVKFSGGTVSQVRTDWTFVDGYNVTWWLNNSGSVWASVMGSDDILNAMVPYFIQLLVGTASVTGTDLIVSADSINGLSFSVPKWITNAKFSAGTLSANRSDVTFSNSNGVSFGLETNGVLTGSVETNYAGTNTSGTNCNLSVDTAGISVSVSDASIGFYAGTTNTFYAQLSFVDSNGVSFGLSNDTLTASVETAYLAESRSTDFVSQSVYITTQSNAFNMIVTSYGVFVTFPDIVSLASSTFVGKNDLGTLSYWANMDEMGNAATTMAQSNTFVVLPLQIPANLSVSYLRLPASINFTSTSIATTQTNTATGTTTGFYETVQWNAVLYKLGAGANSRSLQYVASSSAGLTWSVTVSQQSTTRASQATIGQSITFPNEGNTTDNVNTAINTSLAANTPIHTSQWSNLSAQRWLDIPFQTLITPGNYWLAFNRFSGTVGGKNMDCNASIYGVSQTNLTFGNMNSATNVSNCAWQVGLGYWTTNVANTTSSMALASITATSSYHVPYVQMIRQA